MDKATKSFGTVIVEAANKGWEIGNDAVAAKQEQRVVIAKRVKALRTEKGISQKELSEAINAAFLTYKGYENCKSDFPIFLLVRIADQLNTSMDYLTGRTEVKDAGSVEDRLKKLEDLLLNQKSGE